MEKRDLIESEVEKTLQVADKIGKAEANPYLFTKIANETEGSGVDVKKFRFRLAFTAMVLCLLANLAFLIYNPVENGSNKYVYSVSDSVRTAQIKSFASEYSSTNNFYFY